MSSARAALRAFGPAIAPADAEPAAWLAALDGRQPLVLAPSEGSGWFGGTALVAFDPVVVAASAGNSDDALRAAGMVLERAFTAEKPQIAVALLPYSGDVRWAVYDRGLLLADDGWHAWGAEPEDGWPAAPEPGHAPGVTSAAHTRPLAAANASSLTEREFVAAVEATRESIRDGDVYVLNLTRTVRSTASLAAAELFLALSERAPATMGAAWIARGGGSILSCSPERFVRLVGHEVEIAPVKGTRPRGADSAADLALATELLGSEKERAEHVMIVDLERNDLGRVCVPGSIRVAPLCALETTSYCHQTVSRVSGLLSPDASIGDLLVATFPCGSVTGAPKIAAMRIAEQLECGPRGIYTGSLVVALPGELDSSVLIRTVDLVGDEATYGTGCGITVDSNAEEEWAESVLKTEPLLGGNASATGSGL